MELGIYFFLGAAVYFLPSWLGSEKQNRSAIFWLNLLLGWSLIGWVVALVWALTKDAAAPYVPPQLSANATKPELGPSTEQEKKEARLKDLRDRGVISQDEFLDLISR